jgi:hypothetical protein
MSDHLATVRFQIARATEALKLAHAALDAAEATPEETAFNPPSTPCEHIRKHLPGQPRKIETDPELRAFIEARVDYMSFSRPAAALAQAFPPERRVAMRTMQKRATAPSAIRNSPRYSAPVRYQTY